ncbi:hypothetical protein KAT63_00095 [Candidatus Parcubacteria bacterium]|nr:hypothetical protein [Candidatus Parcubacteria bacterium]
MNKKISKKLLSGFSVGIGLLLFLLLLPLENIYAITFSCDFQKHGIGIDDFSYWGFAITILIMIVLWIISPRLIKKIKNNVCKKVIAFLIITFSLYIISFHLVPLFIGIRYDFGEFAKCKIHNGEYVSRKDNFSGCTAKCRLINNDHGKLCKNNSDCEGFCEIENFSEIKKRWDKNFYDLKTEYDAYQPIALDEWIAVTGIEPIGKCNKFKETLFFSNICINDCTVIRVTDGNITRVINTYY